jgi:nitric oxide reductase subunit B
MQTGLMNTLRWMRIVGDTIFAVGALVLGWFVLGLVTGHSFDRRSEVREGEADVHPVTHSAIGD